MILVIAVSHTNTNLALAELSHAINELKTVHKEGFFVVAGNFNHANLKTVLPKFHQPRTSQPEERTAWTKCTNVHGAYKAAVRPQIGTSPWHCDAAAHIHITTETHKTFQKNYQSLAK